MDSFFRTPHFINIFAEGDANFNLQHIFGKSCQKDLQRFRFVEMVYETFAFGSRNCTVDILDNTVIQIDLMRSFLNDGLIVD